MLFVMLPVMPSVMLCHVCRKITVHDTNPDLFRVFLGYLYSGQLTSELTVEQLADLMTLSDRYEVSCLGYKVQSCLFICLQDPSVVRICEIDSH